jgi:broad specificity phosphatase PhoE
VASRNDRTPATTYLCFVRHGTTPTTGKVLPGTAPGLHLSDRGRAEAAAVAGRLSELGSVRALYCSHVDRALETAALIGEQLGLEPIVDSDLADTDVGEWTGKSLAVMRRRKEWRQVVGHPAGFRFPGGESFAEVYARVAAAVERITSQQRGKVVVVVSHADPIKMALLDTLGVPFDLLNRLSVGPCSTSVMAIGDLPRVLAVNSYADPALVGVPARDGAAPSSRRRR